MADPVPNPDPTPNPNPNPEPTPTPDDLLAAARKREVDATAEAARLKKENDELKMQGLKSKDDWKGVADAEKTRADNAEAENAKIKKALVDEAKYSALRSEAQRQGINPISIPDLELLDFSEVTADSVNGRVSVIGVEKAITDLKAKRPNWFTGGAPQVNSNTPEGGVRAPNGNVTLADVKAAEAKYYSSKSESDKKIYEETIRKFKAQG